MGLSGRPSSISQFSINESASTSLPSRHATRRATRNEAQFPAPYRRVAGDRRARAAPRWRPRGSKLPAAGRTATTEPSRRQLHPAWSRVGRVKSHTPRKPMKRGGLRANASSKNHPTMAPGGNQSTDDRDKYETSRRFASFFWVRGQSAVGSGRNRDDRNETIRNRSVPAGRPRAPAASAEQWLHIRVEEGRDGDETVNVNVPLSVVEAMLPAISVNELHRGAHLPGRSRHGRFRSGRARPAGAGARLP